MVDWWISGLMDWLEEELSVITPFGTVSNAYTNPLPAAKKISGRPFTVASEGADQVL